MKYLLKYLIFCSMALIATAASAGPYEGDSTVFGDWQLTLKNGEIRYASIVWESKFNRIKFIECEVAKGHNGEDLAIVVCPTKVTAGVILKEIAPRKLKIVTSGHAFTTLEVSETEMTVSGLFGYFSETWTRADKDLIFVFAGE